MAPENVVGGPEILSACSQRRLARQSHRQERAFIKGPLPLPWLKRAQAAGPSALTAGLAVWFYRGLNGNDEFQVTVAALASAMGCEPRTIQRGLVRLTKVGLVRVQRPNGRRLLIRIVYVLCTTPTSENPSEMLLFINRTGAQ